MKKWWFPQFRVLALFVIVVWSACLLAACGGPAEIEFAVKHLRDQTGEQISEIVSYEKEAGLDNSKGEAPLQVQIEFKRNFRNQINTKITDNGVSGQRVQDKIVELYKLPPNDPEGTVQTALCPISVVVPAHQKAKVTVEWTERWAEGIINEGREGNGKRLGTYSVFLGYIEPCSLVGQDNVN
ncbi:MAG: hypothetical protein U0350_49375 [Caldilineaceae bacterium]